MRSSCLPHSSTTHLIGPTASVMQLSSATSTASTGTSSISITATGAASAKGDDEIVVKKELGDGRIFMLEINEMCVQLFV
jgi:hypothetical protein